MGVLAAIVAALLVCACYSPDIRDCTLACNADSDCVRDQICTADHFCAMPALARGCGDFWRDAGTTDSTPPPDARPDAPPDASPYVELHIHIDGAGIVNLAGGPTCAMADCMTLVLKNVPATVTAVPNPNKQFDHWTSTTCMNQPPICMFTPTAATTVSVKFH